MKKWGEMIVGRGQEEDMKLETQSGLMEMGAAAQVSAERGFMTRDERR